MRLSDFDFHLPDEAIALRPAEPRDSARLLVVKPGQGLEDRVVRDLPDFLRPSLTARDIANAPSLPSRARGAFSEIARIVEAALFARRPVGAEGWQKARGAYERFAFRDAWT